MRIPPRITSRIAATFALAAALLVGGPVAGAATAAPAAVTASAPRIAAVGDICLSDLPAQAHDTLDLIEEGGPYPYPQDGTVFQNREGVLPSQSSGYYHEYTVVTPGSSDRGARRIVTGDEDREDFYTSDHYESFDLVDHTC
ncbi:ribonuclease [Streptomyces tsukubensis]|uniref:Ribonuclease n=1 Tax=Streptomyces tsukubensis TaxID=83656 RepID=A0A1V4ADU7_9ACTN|nr:ribonuclease [Streptomyces tsukubensis]OON81653.1 ribonuclease [Streptomyces tsukubensis]QFR96428.1 ribonuclease [Streptomyces tsukubensis]